MSLNSVKRYAGLGRAHLEKARGSLEQNQDYCKKEGGFIYEEGTPMQQGRRNDLIAIKEKICKGTTMEEIADQHFSMWVQYRRSFQEYYAMKNTTVRNWETHVTVLIGRTGVGKTRFAIQQAADDGYWTPGDYKWFDGYNQHKIVIFDDYRGEYPLPLFLRLLDRYAMQVPIKGGFVNWAPKRIYITSNTHPRQWYDGLDRLSYEAMLRRMNRIETIISDIFSDE